MNRQLKRSIQKAFEAPKPNDIFFIITFSNKQNQMNRKKLIF